MHLFNSDLISYLGTIIDYRFDMKSFVPFLVLFFAFTLGLNAQLNNYKYIIVPKKFDAFKKENQHLTSTLIKHLLVQKGFNVVYEGDEPEDLRKDGCLGLKVNLLDESSLFRTKSSLVLNDCELKPVFTTIQGTSKSKDYKEAYSESIREAFSSFDIVEYNYTPKEKEKAKDTLVLNFKNDVKSLDSEREPAIVQQTATIKEQSYQSKEPRESEIVKGTGESLDSPTTSSVDQSLLYALKTETGYNLTDSNANIKYRLLSTSVDNIFLLDQEGQNGVVFKKEDKWYLESAEKGKKVLKELNIKF